MGVQLKWSSDPQFQALDRIGVSKYTRKYLKCLQKLCGLSGVLPQSFALAAELEGVEKEPFSGGGFSDVYKATYKGQAVVVKALRIDSFGDPNLTLMVCAPFGHSIPTPLTRRNRA